jgi:hypothetical protein
MSSGANDVVQELHGGPAVLERELRVHLLNASVSGCLVASNVRIAVGTIGIIRVELNGEEYEDEMQVLRCQEIAGAGSVYHLGMQFLWTAPPNERSIRHALARGVGTFELPKTTRVN